MGKLIDQILKIPYGMFNFLAYRGFFKWIPDEPYLKIQYKTVFGCELNLDKPKTFNEKLQWLKLHDRNPLYALLVDKYEARKYIKEKLGEEYLIPLVGGPWKNADEIKFDELPNQFVLKCTHDSGGLVICRDKNTLNIKATKKMLNKKLKKNYYYWAREWPYKDVKPQIIAEQYMVDESGSELKDYKIFNFNGKAKFIQVDFGRFKEHRRNLYDTEWNQINMGYNYPFESNKLIEKPIQIEKMLQFAEKLSYDTMFLRTDFYSIKNNIYFGEITFYPECGLGKFNPESMDVQIGSWLNLTNNIIN